MGKRKGSEIAAPPPTASVIVPDASDESSSPLPSVPLSMSRSAISSRDDDPPSSPSTELSAPLAALALSGSCDDDNDTISAMNEILELYAGPNPAKEAVAAVRCVKINESLPGKRATIVREARDVQELVARRIEDAERSLHEESDELSRLAAHISSLQGEANSIEVSIRQLERERMSSEERAERYREEASQTVEAIDEVESAKIREVPRIKRQISLYASTTGIKWDFERTDVLAGEVAVPSKGCLKRFEINLEENSDYEVANKIWAMMEGQ